MNNPATTKNTTAANTSTISGKPIDNNPVSRAVNLRANRSAMSSSAHGKFPTRWAAFNTPASACGTKPVAAKLSHQSAPSEIRREAACNCRRM